MLDGPAAEKGAAFLKQFPDSALRLPVHELLTRVWRDRGDAQRAIGAAAAGLALAPDYIPLLVELADLTANGAAGFDRAEASANRALTLLESAKAPHRIDAARWTAEVAKLRARARSALGLIRFKRDDIPGAIAQFQAALAEPSSETPIIHYRLGRLHAVTGRKQDARHHLLEALKTGSEDLRHRANAALAELKQ